MSYVQYPISVNFGASKSGLSGRVAYEVLSATNEILVCRTTTGVSERTDSLGSPSTGLYDAVVSLDTTWGNVRVNWDITDMAVVAAQETISVPGIPVSPDHQLLLDIKAKIDTLDGSASLSDEDRLVLNGIKTQTDRIPLVPAAIGDTMKIDLHQALPDTADSNSVGGALKAESFGKWILNGTELTVFVGVDIHSVKVLPMP